MVLQGRLAADAGIDDIDGSVVVVDGVVVVEGVVTDGVAGFIGAGEVLVVPPVDDPEPDPLPLSSFRPQADNTSGNAMAKQSACRVNR